MVSIHFHRSMATKIDSAKRNLCLRMTLISIGWLNGDYD